MSKSPSEAPIAWVGSTRTILSMQVRSGLLRHQGVAGLENRHRGRHGSADAPSVSSAHDRMPPPWRRRPLPYSWVIGPTQPPRSSREIRGSILTAQRTDSTVD
jgi:hypothetical protein